MSKIKSSFLILKSIVREALWLSRFQIIETLRQPSYLVSTLLLPPMFFGFFAVPNIKTIEAAQFMMGSFSCFAFLGVVMFQFGVAVALDRNSRWSVSLRNLPIHSSAILLSRLLTGLPFAIAAVATVVVSAHLMVDVQFKSDQWMMFLLGVILGGLPFSALGLLIGVLSSPRSVLPIANLIYLPLSFGGGLWLPPNALPASIEKISEILPTRLYGEIVWALIGGKDFKTQDFWGLVLFFVLSLSAAIYFFQKDEGEKFN